MIEGFVVGASIVLAIEGAVKMAPFLSTLIASLTPR
jgi:hypothetical protein